MSFIWNWWSGKKEDEKGETVEEEKKGGEEEEKEEEEKENEEKEKENEEKENEEKENNENEEKNENNENEEKNENNKHNKIKSNLSGISEEEENQNISETKEEEEITKKSLKTSKVKLGKKGDGSTSIKKNLNDKLSQENRDNDLKLDKSDPLHWKSVVYGPENSPYENGKFDILINFEEDKPNEKPVIKFLTKIYHYNVKQNDGVVLCPYIWNKHCSEEDNMKKIKLLMNTPDTRYPCSNFIKQEYYNDYQKYKNKALKFTEDYAMIK